MRLTIFPALSRTRERQLNKKRDDSVVLVEKFRVDRDALTFSGRRGFQEFLLGFGRLLLGTVLVVQHGTA